MKAEYKRRYCPFCGYEESALISGNCIHHEGMFMAYVECQHCAARGSKCAGEETLEEAIEGATWHWNEGSQPIWEQITRRVRYTISAWLPFRG